MKKGEIVALSNEALLAHFGNLNTIMAHQENSRGGMTNITRKDYMWTVDEMVKRFNLDRFALTQKNGTAHFFFDDYDEYLRVEKEYDAKQGGESN